MDPDATLARIRAAIADGDADVAVEAFADLDEWLRRGGFLPADWSSPVTS